MQWAQVFNSAKQNFKITIVGNCRSKKRKLVQVGVERNFKRALPQYTRSPDKNVDNFGRISKPHAHVSLTNSTLADEIIHLTQK